MLDITLQCILYSIPMVLHVCSVGVLYLAKDSGLQHNQRYYLMNLSISEIVICLFGIVKRLWKYYDYYTAYRFVHIFQTGVGTFAHYSVMTALTCDRFLEVFLNIKYPLYCSEERTKKIIFGIWMLAASFTSFLYIIEIECNSLLTTQVLLYFYPLFAFTCVIVALCTYAYIFVKVNKRERTESCSTFVSESNSHKIFYRMRQTLKHCSLLALLMASFTFFIMIPESIYFYYGLHDRHISHTLKTILTTFYFCAYSCDVFIYLVASKAIRKTLLIKLGIVVKGKYKFRATSTGGSDDFPAPSPALI